MKSFKIHLSDSLQPVPSLGWELAERLSQDEKGVREVVLEVNGNGTTSVLREAVDTSQGPSEHGVWLLAAEDRVLVLGGLTAYWLDRSGQVVGTERMFRDARNEEYWDLRIVTTQAGAVVVYEGGAMFLAPDLRLHWHVQKRYNDVLEKIEGDRVYFLSETGERWSVPITR